MVLRSKHRCRRNLTIELNSGRLSNMINSPCREQYHKWTRVIFDDFEWKLHLLCGCVFSPSEKKSFMIFCKMLDMNWIFPFDYTHFCKNNNHFSSCNYKCHSVIEFSKLYCTRFFLIFYVIHLRLPLFANVFIIMFNVTNSLMQGQQHNVRSSQNRVNHKGMTREVHCI